MQDDLSRCVRSSSAGSLMKELRSSRSGRPTNTSPGASMPISSSSDSLIVPQFAYPCGD
jgi:hypothetical protein